MEHKSASEVLRTIKRTWPKCTDITKRDIEIMFKEIKLVNTPEFVNGKKYSIEEMQIDHTDKKFTTKLFNELGEIKEKFSKIQDTVLGAPIKAIEYATEKTFKKDKQSQSNSPKTTDNQDEQPKKQKIELDKNHKSKSAPTIDIPKYGRTEEEKLTGGEITVKHIVPFDYDHKGILEPNKEFNGYIQQFIAIKEMFNDPVNNKNMFIKDVSMSYLYVSHPIFVQLYSGVCGFTGTIGGKADKEVFRNHYNLQTLKIPRKKPNRRVDMPIVLCRSILQRNQRIAEEVFQFNQRGNPVLVIFQDLNEISLMYKMLRSRGITNINVFDGRDQKIKPDYIAGRKGAVSLGTNVCGRGTDIKKPQKPLHVIISYYTSNVRVMQQAFGRTGRKGKRGTVHIICHKEQYITPLEIIKDDNLIDVLEDFRTKNQLQVDFINKFKETRGWIFEPITESEKLDSSTIGQLRKARINVNRIVAFNYRFPLCLSIDTFLKIQAQKIFSLFNCPNCKYTWILFQRYIREMIFESWSLFIEQSERYFIGKKLSKESKNQYMAEESENLYKKISQYLPTSEAHCGIVETFMWIYKKVVSQWENKVFQIFNDNTYLRTKQTNTERFLTFNFGFRPYCLMDCSGARISEVDEDNKNQAFITDPELSYTKKVMGKEHPVAISITEAIDNLFNKICNVITNALGGLIGIKFFLRRTLGGCEFGLCVDFDLASNDESFICENCLIDRDPLLVFTISVKSMAPLLAGVLIFALVFLASMSTSIGEYVTSFGAKFGIDVAKKAVKKVLEQLVLTAFSSQLEAFCQKIIDFLYKKLKQQIEIINVYDAKTGAFLDVLSQIIDTSNFKRSGKSLNKMFNKKVKLKVNSRFAQSFVTEGLPLAHMFKIGLLLMLCLAGFIIGFNNKKKAIAESKEEKNAAAFDKDPKSPDNLENLQKSNESAYEEKDKISLDFPST